MSGIPARSADADSIDDIAYFAKKIARSQLRLETQLAAGLPDDHPTVKTERGIAERETKRLALLLEAVSTAGNLPEPDALAAACEDEEEGIGPLAVIAIMEAAGS